MLTIKQLRREERRMVARWLGGFSVESPPDGEPSGTWFEDAYDDSEALDRRLAELRAEGGAA